ncbi:MAG: exodeoxyribonuclease V subunit beta [Chlorobiaceae bacterium]
MKRLEHGAVALGGVNLIEASAGTGKTYAIASLYLRLLVELELAVEEILVVTYTEAATKELRGKIRGRIREAIEVLEGADTEDGFLRSFFEASSRRGLTAVKEILERALGDFDTASIYTIHGFCLRALQDNVFESGSLYDTELITDQRELMQELLDDFWRIHFFGESAPLLGYALQHRASEVFKELLYSLHGGAGARVIPEFSRDDIAALDASCHKAFKEVGQMWRAEREFIEEVMRCDKGLGRAAESYRIDLIEPLFACMDAFVGQGNPFDLFNGFIKFTRSGITKGTKPKSLPPVHSFFDCCEGLLGGVQERFLALQAELADFYRRSLPLRKQAGNVRFFDDLLEDLYQALVSERGGAALAELLRQKYGAALIDEFQDTDPVQYAIFRAIYAGTDAPLFLIGDPKQAIYSFRGADIFAYMQAARDVGDEKRFTLTENWRSTPGLLKAFNSVFDQKRNPFIFEGILYHPLDAGGAQELAAAGAEDMAPLQLWLMDSPDVTRGILTVDDAGIFASDAVAGEIERLLMEDREVSAGDIAVIVRTHRQAGIVLNALRARGIAGVMRSDMTIFASTEAQEVSVLLSALCDAGNERKIRSALVTDIFGRTGDDIARLIDDEEAWTRCIGDFHHYHHRWLERGFMVMIRELMAKEGVRGRFLGAPDASGERRLTNLLQCFELLHRQEHERRPGMEGLATWFSERLGAADEAEEYQIRLERDEAAVKIVTVHISKGLEYPIVFCPFLWGEVSSKGNVLMFHDDEGQLVKDFGSREYALHRLRAVNESLAESLRLLYVAMTRAKKRCYLLTAKTRAEVSAVNYLLFASDEARRAENQATALRAESKTLTVEKMAVQMEAVANGSEGSIAFTRPGREVGDGATTYFRKKATPEGNHLFRHTFSGTVDTSWRVSSFTSFSRHEQRPAELPDRDDALAGGMEYAAGGGEKSIFSFPRGAQAGIFMHWIFEKLDFASPTPERVRDLVEKGLERYSYSFDWLPHISGMVQNVLRSSTGTFKLGRLRAGCWITELEFFFPLKFITSSRLAESLARHGVTFGGAEGGALAEALQFRPVKGMLMGFIDMVLEEGGRYYLLDWKSNHLGNGYQDYGEESMRDAMAKNMYTLQYLLYTVALNRYLSLRVKNYSYSTHFGGVIYVFLRGVSGEEGETTGFYRDCPDEELIRELTQLLIEGGE